MCVVYNSTIMLSLKDSLEVETGLHNIKCLNILEYGRENSKRKYNLGHPELK